MTVTVTVTVTLTVTVFISSSSCTLLDTVEHNDQIIFLSNKHRPSNDNELLFSGCYVHMQVCGICTSHAYLCSMRSMRPMRGFIFRNRGPR